MGGRIFLSYAREDLDLVRWEAQTMQMLGHEVFLDVHSLRAGVDWPAALLGEIRDAERFVLFWSAFSARSEWVGKEYAAALAVRGAGERPYYLQIVLLDGEPLPEALAGIQAIDRSTEERVLLVTDEVRRSYLQQGIAGLLGMNTLIHLQAVTPRTVRVVAQKAEATFAEVAAQAPESPASPGAARLPAHFAFPAYRARRGGGRTLIFVPGFMGSQLFSGRRRIWVDAMSLLLGRIDRLAIGRAGVTADGLTLGGGDFFVDQMALTTHVVIWPYDWRQAVAEAAAGLAARLRAFLDADEGGEPVFVAHGHGCAVMRALAAGHPALWQQARARSGGAAVVFVAPHEHGTWRAAEILLGCSEILRKLGLLDLKHSAREVHALFSGFPSVLEMLPCAAGADLFAPEWWADKACRPPARALARARATRAALLEAIAPQDILCVLGEAAATPAGVRLEQGRLQWTSTPRGDGTTPWALGLAPGVRAYRAGMGGNQLMDNPGVVRAISDLVDHGATNLLPPHEDGRR